MHSIGLFQKNKQTGAWEQGFEDMAEFLARGIEEIAIGLEFLEVNWKQCGIFKFQENMWNFQGSWF